jgi:hypothetical protein
MTPEWQELIEYTEQRLLNARGPQKCMQLEALLRCFRRDAAAGRLTPIQIALLPESEWWKPLVVGAE